MKPLAVDLCCGLGGWTHGLLAEGWDVVGFDIENHQYGEDNYPAQLVLQDILTIDGRQFRGKVSLVVASPPCQFFSYTSMPWTRAKQLAAAVRADPVRLEKELALFRACERIGLEAGCPVVIENVRGAQPWVGRARGSFGSFMLWGDVPALMPMTRKAQKFNPDGTAHPPGSWFAIANSKNRGAQGQKVPGFRFDGSGKSFQTASVEGIKQHGFGREWFAGDGKISRVSGSKSNARKAASAAIAKIPLPLARHIANYWKPA